MAHIIMVTKYRKPLLHNAFRNVIKQYIFDICVQRRWYIKRMETDRDHIHILLQYNPTDNITKIVSSLKQQSTWLAWKSYGATLQKHYWRERTVWSDGYFAASVGQVSQETIERYIEQQG